MSTAPASLAPRRTARPVGERRIAVIDGAFEPGFVAIFESWLAKQAYYRVDQDNEQSGDFRHFTHKIALDAAASNPLYRNLLSVVEREIHAAYAELSPSLIRMYVNLTTYGDHFAPHVDDDCGVTAIYYANAEWPDEWQGETLFYSGGEAVAVVAPRPGRIAMLPADMEHRVGPCSRLCSGARYTVAFKYRTERKPA